MYQYYSFPRAFPVSLPIVVCFVSFIPLGFSRCGHIYPDLSATWNWSNELCYRFLTCWTCWFHDYLKKFSGNPSHECCFEWNIGCFYFVGHCNWIQVTSVWFFRFVFTDQLVKNFLHAYHVVLLKLSRTANCHDPVLDSKFLPYSWLRSTVYIVSCSM